MEFGKITSKVQSISKDQLKELSSFLTPLRNIRLEFCKEKLPTLQEVVPLSRDMQAHFLATTDVPTEMKEHCQEVFKEHFEKRMKPIHKVATFFIPMAFQAKLLSDSDFDLILLHLKTFDHEETDFYSEQQLTTTIEPAIQESVSQNRPSSGYLSMMSRIVNTVQSQVKTAGSSKRSIEDEARAFKNATFQIEEVGDEILKFWATQRFKYPKLYRASRFYLAVPATSLIIERHFNLTGMTLDLKRLSLDVDNLNYLSTIKSNSDKFELSMCNFAN